MSELKDRKDFSIPTISAWGTIHDLTRLGGTDGPGDFQKNPAGEEVGAEDGSIFNDNFETL